MFRTSVPNRMITSRGVVMEFDTGDLIYTLTRDGEAMPYESGQIITEPGYYCLKAMALPDILAEDVPEPTKEQLYGEAEMPEFALYEDGNVYQGCFYFFIPGKAENRLNYINAPEGYQIGYVEKNGKRVPKDSPDWQRLKEDGSYRFLWNPVKEGLPVCESVLVRDTRAPFLEIEGVKDGGYSKRGITVYADETNTSIKVTDSSISWILDSSKLDRPGIYEITAVDAAGNQSRYGIVIEMDMTGAMVLAAAAMVAAIGGCIWYIHIQKMKIQVR
ncbi:MAG: hypothetical protein LUG90_01725 [Clostridiaceae bacterium]|nr:hypothetical protein [Clostridiaceae bacterium]